AQTLMDCGYAPSDEPAQIAKVFFYEWSVGWYLVEGAVEALKRLGPKFTLGVITNGQTDGQRGKLRKLELDPYFSVILVSAELGIGKPSPGIFLEAARLVGVTPGEAAHIGDSLTTDIAGANRAGMLSVWLNRAGRDLQPG